MLDEGFMLAHARECVVLDDGLGIDVRLMSRNGVILDARLVLSKGFMLCMGVRQCIIIDW